jgi:hypothetical protein
MVFFNTSPEGAQVYVNDEYQGKSPLRWSAGETDKKYKIRYTLKNYQTEEFELQYPKLGQSLDLTKALVPATDKKKAKGKVTVNCGPGWGEVFVDNKKVAEATPADLSLEEGDYTIATKNPFSGNGSEKRVHVTSGGSTRVTLACK